MCSEPTIKRLYVYHRYLNKIESVSDEWISCTKIANALDLLPIQVRKDLAVTDVIGKPKVGYNVFELKKSLERFLGFGEKINACLIGAGYLGYALLRYPDFTKYGLNIKYVFDNDSNKIGQKIIGVEVLDIKDIEKVLKNKKIDIAILTVPQEFAQDIANKIIDFGIKAIWNFAPTRLAVPRDVVVKHENIAGSFFVLSKRFKNK